MRYRIRTTDGTPAVERIHLGNFRYWMPSDVVEFVTDADAAPFLERQRDNLEETTDPATITIGEVVEPEVEVRPRKPRRS